MQISNYKLRAANLSGAISPKIVLPALVLALVAGLSLSLYPLQSIVVAICFAGLGIVYLSPRWGLYLLVFLIPLESLFVITGTTWAIKFGGAVVLIAWFANVACSHKTQFHYSRVFILSGVFCIWVVSSGLWAISLPNDYYSACLSFLSILGFCFFANNVITTRREFICLLAVFLFSTVLSATIALWQALSLTGLVGGRASGGSLDPNELAVMLVASIPFGLALMTSSSKRSISLLFVCAVVILTMGVLVTGSRTGALLLGVALLSCIWIFHNWKTKFVVLSASFASFTVGWLWFGSTVLSRFQDLSLLGGREEISRFQLWKLALRVLETNPVLGVGIGNLRYILPLARSSDFAWSTTINGNPVAHNSYISIVSEIGIVGLVIFLLVLLLSLLQSLKMIAYSDLSKSNFYRSGLDRALFSSLSIVLIAASTLNLEKSKLLWFLIVATDIIWRFSRAEDLQEQSHRLYARAKT